MTSLQMRDSDSESIVVDLSSAVSPQHAHLR